MSDSFTPPSYPPPPPPPSGGDFSSQSNKKDKVVAGLLGIFLGGLGIHKFYLGGKEQKQAAIIMLLVSVIGTCFFFVGPFISAVIGFIEGIVYLTKDDAEFQSVYVDGDKAWF